MKNLENMLIGDDLAKYKNTVKKIFFYRICGTGMGACACIAKEAGFEVAGADVSFAPPMSNYLESMDIPLFSLDDVTVQMLNEYDLIIVGNSLSGGSDKARFVESSGTPFTSFPSFLGEFILKDKEVIGVCGTHGKTSTTYFMTQILEALGEGPGYFIGGIIDGREPSRLGRGKLFLIEADEYDTAYFQKISKFRLYQMKHMILTSLEFDHGDIFDSVEDIKDEFRATIPTLNGKIIANDAYDTISDLQNEFKNKDWMFYGERSKLGPFDVMVDDTGSKFSLLIKEEKVQFQTNIVGLHNILNISSCILLLSQLGHKSADLQGALKKLGMVKRRQEVRGKYQGMTVIDDFGHHPKAITLTIDAIKSQYPSKKIISIFEPVSATARSSIFQKEFAESLKASDKIIIAENTLRTTVGDGTNLDCDKLVAQTESMGISSFCAKSLESLRLKINEWTDDEYILLVLSNRTCLGLWESDFVKELT